MNTVVFGTGIYYRNRKEKINSQTEIVAFLDNNPLKQGQKLDGKEVLSPDSIVNLKYDVVILMCGAELRGEFRRQLNSFGIENDKIWSWNKFQAIINCNNIQLSKMTREKRDTLIITDEMGFNGGSIAAEYLAIAIMGLGHHVTIMTPGIDERFKMELEHKCISFVVWNKIPYIEKNDLQFFNGYKLIIVNTFQMSNCALILRETNRTIVWIHEPEDMYAITIDEFPQLNDKVIWEDIPVFAVSTIAAHNYESFLRNNVNGLLPYGIPDQRRMGEKNKDENDPIVFAIIGAIGELKGHDVFLDAIKQFEDHKYKVEYWIIGGHASENYNMLLEEASSRYKNIKRFGERSHEETIELLSSVDVIVSPSRRDSLPITITEGLMNGIPCIVSDACGTSQLLEDFVNVRICKAGDVESLYKCMCWMVENKAERIIMGERGRQMYDKVFSMNAFMQRVQRDLLLNE